MEDRIYRAEQNLQRVRKPMPRVQAIVCREDRILMVKHWMDGEEWWCLPGGGLEPGEEDAEAALRELREECNVEGTVVRRTAHVDYGGGDIAISFLIDIGDQEPSLGHDPEFPGEEQVLVGLRWMRLDDLAERDRVYLWSAGLLGVEGFLEEIETWEDRGRYASDTVENKAEPQINTDEH